MPIEARTPHNGGPAKRKPATAANQPGQSPEAFLEPGASPPPANSSPRRKPSKVAHNAPPFVDDCTLEKFVRPITHMTAILSDLTCINPDQRGTGTEQAITWLAVELNSRAEELRAILHREPPRWFTNMEADARCESLEEYCGRSIPKTPDLPPEWVAALASIPKT